MVLHAELHGFRKRWAAPSNREDIPDVHGSPEPVMESEPCGASEGARSELGQQLNFSENVISNTSSSSGILDVHPTPQLHTQQTGVVTALSILRSAKRVKLPWETGPLAPVFNTHTFSRRFEIRPQMVGLADVLNPQPKVRAAIPVHDVFQQSQLAVRKRIVLTSYNVKDDLEP